MVFVARGNQSSAFNGHFPKMVAAAGRRCVPDESTRLIGFSKPCSERLSSCLAVARVSSLAIVRDAPGSEALWKFVQEYVPRLDDKWLWGAQDVYKVTNIKSIETSVGLKKRKIDREINR